MRIHAVLVVLVLATSLVPIRPAAGLEPPAKPEAQAEATPQFGPECPEYPAYDADEMLPSELSAFQWREYRKTYTEDERIAYHRGFIAGFVVLAEALQLSEDHIAGRYANCFQAFEALQWAVNTEIAVIQDACSSGEMPVASAVVRAMAEQCGITVEGDDEPAP